MLHPYWLARMSDSETQKTRELPTQGGTLAGLPRNSSAFSRKMQEEEKEEEEREKG